MQTSHDNSEIMSTIEPRLIALLNNDAPYESYPSPPSLELPPLQDPNILKASGRPLLLEPDASKRNDKLQHANLISGIEEDEGNKKTSETSKRALGNSSPQSLRKILDNDGGSAPSLPSKKRSIIESSKDDFVQLPQPPKKHKAAKQVVPPIIIGLFQPPPQATLFPPIASSAFHDSHGRNSLNTVPLKLKDVQDRGKPDTAVSPVAKKKPQNKEKKRKDVKARKKWTEEETNNLLLGVHKHGVGKWSDILDDPNFTFNERSGVDLKDRFRTCCPNELRSNVKAKAAVDEPSAKGTKKSTKSSLLSENILINEETFSAQDNGNDEQAPTKPRKLRAHRKNVEDLVQLGIDGPFRKSQRRERRPFTDEDDREILEGYQIYGPAWTRIQRDSRFHLQTRQATDLRDRFRNKYPEKFRSDDSGPKNTRSTTDTREKEKENAQQTPASTLQQSSSREGLRIHEMISEDSSTTPKVLPLQSHTSNVGFKDNFVYPEQPAEQVDGIPSFDWNPAAPFTSSMGEMDISRLLLDSEPWMENTTTTGRDKQPFTDINSILTSTSDDIPQISSYYGLLVNEEPLTMTSSVPLDNDASFA